jgi:hypothetical protein
MGFLHRILVPKGRWLFHTDHFSVFAENMNGTGRRLTEDRAKVGTEDAAERPAVAAGTW